MRYRRTIAVLTAFLVGIWLGSANTNLLPSWVPWLLLGAVPFFRIKGVFLVVIVLILSFSYARGFRRAHHRTFSSGTVTFTGTVLSPPDIRRASQYLRVRTDQPLATTVTNKAATGVVLVKTDPYLPVKLGDHIEAQGKLELPEPFEGFNYPLFLERDHVFAILPLAKVKVIDSPTSAPLLTNLSALRTKLEAMVNRYIPEPESSFLSGLLFGSRRAIPTDVSNSLKATGTSHLVAISGANITFITAGALMVIPITNRLGQSLVVILVATFLCLLTGGSASVVRGAVIAGLSSLIRAAGRRAWPVVTILFAASLMLFFNPLLLRADPGFQLSFAAYAGLLIFSNTIGTLAEKVRLPPSIRGSFTETGAASLGTLPLTIASGSFAARGLIVNPLVLWLIPPVTALGFILLASAVFPPLATLIALPTWGILHLALSIISIGGKL